jgi:hypothetical protein
MLSLLVTSMKQQGQLLVNLEGRIGEINKRIAELKELLHKTPSVEEEVIAWAEEKRATSPSEIPEPEWGE